MDLHSAWLLVLAVAVPIAGVVGFGVQLRNVKKLRLENDKLSLEIRTLEHNLKKAEARIVVPTTEQVRHFTMDHDIRFSRSGRLDSKPSKEEKKLLFWRTFDRFDWGVAAFLTFVLLYALYDLYRLLNWLVGWFQG